MRTTETSSMAVTAHEFLVTFVDTKVTRIRQAKRAGEKGYQSFFLREMVNLLSPILTSSV